MPTGVLLDSDDLVADCLFMQYNLTPMKHDGVVGLVSAPGNLVGAIMFTNFNGNNVELNYYGERTLTKGLVKFLAQHVLTKFNPSRVTVITSKKKRRLMKSLLKFGFRFEGIQKRFYGHTDCNVNVGCRFVIFREEIEALARFGNVGQSVIPRLHDARA